MRETLKHVEAFNYYYSLGTKRSFKLVQREFNVSNNTVARWSKAFHWQDRIKERDQENAERLKAETDKAIVQSKKDYRELISRAVKEFARKLEAGEIQIRKVDDLVALAKLDLLLAGESSNDNDLVIKIIPPEHLRE